MPNAPNVIALEKTATMAKEMMIMIDAGNAGLLGPVANTT
jgi:hypothetical protein